MACWPAVSPQSRTLRLGEREEGGGGDRGERAEGLRKGEGATGSVRLFFPHFRVGSTPLLARGKVTATPFSSVLRTAPVTKAV